MIADSQAVFGIRGDLNPLFVALAEPLACCVHSVRKGGIELGDDVVVIGAGVMGAFHIKLAKMRGSRVIACEVDPARLEIARRMGADVLINSKDKNAAEAVKELTEGRGADAVFCTAAIPSLAEEAIKMTGKFGRVVMYSSFHPKDPIPLDVNSVHYSEIIITGSVNPGIRDFYTAVRLLSLGLVDPSGLVSGSYPLENIREAFQHAVAPGTYRVIVTC
jgi:L-iditol 2-dehydrogenase